MRTVGHDDQIERSVRGACLVLDMGARSVMLDRDDLGRRDQPGRRGLEALVQQLEQVAAMDAEAEGVRVQLAVVQVEDTTTAGGPPVDAVDPRA